MQLTINTYAAGGANSAPLTTFSSLSIDAGELTVNEDINITSGNSFTFEVEKESLVSIKINKPGYYPYSIIVKTFTFSMTFPINLNPIILDETPYTETPYPICLTYHDNCKKALWFYDWDSYPSESEWYLNGELVHVGKSGYLEFDEVGTIQLIQRKKSYYPGIEQERLVRWDRFKGNFVDGNAGFIQNPSPGVGVDQPAEFYLSQFEHDTNSIVNPLPDVSILPSMPNNGECYSKGETVTVKAVIASTFGSTINAKWRVVSNKTESITDLGQTETPEDLTFTLTDIGEYKVEFIHETICSVKTYTVIINCCNFYEVITDCDKFTVSNHSTKRTVSVSITDYANKDIGIEVEELSPGESIAYSLDTGQYIVAFTYEGKEEVQIISNFCLLEECMAAYIETVLCEDVDYCEKDVAAEQAAMRNLALTNTYFMYLNQFHSLANYYTALNDTLLADLYNAEQVLLKLKKMCERLGCKGIDCKPTKTKTNSNSNCGCK